MPPSPRTPSVTRMPAHARRPDHPGRMELDEFHVDQLRAGVVGERMAVASVFPTVARDLVGAPDAAGGEHDGFGAKNLEASAFAIVAKGPDDSIAILQQRRGRCAPCGHRCLDECRGPAACGSFPVRCDRRRGRGADICGRRNFAAESGRPWCDRRPRPRPRVRARASGASLACSSAIRQLLTYCPPRIVSAKWTCQLSRSSTLASAAAMPPSAITVCALPSSDLQTIPTETPAAEASIAARSPAPPRR